MSSVGGQAIFSLGTCMKLVVQEFPGNVAFGKLVIDHDGDDDIVRIWIVSDSFKKGNFHVFAPEKSVMTPSIFMSAPSTGGRRIGAEIIADCDGSSKTKINKKFVQYPLWQDACGKETVAFSKSFAHIFL